MILNVAHPERLAEMMAKHARSNVPDNFVVTPNGFVVIEQLACIFERNLNETLFDTSFFLLEQSIATNEATCFVPRNGEPEPSFDW